MCYQFKEYLHKFRVMHVKKDSQSESKVFKPYTLHKKLSFLILIVYQTMTFPCNSIVRNVCNSKFNEMNMELCHHSLGFQLLKNIRMCLRKYDMNCDIVMTIYAFLEIFCY